MKHAWTLVLALAAWVSAPPLAAAEGQGVKVALLPAAVSVSPGSEFELSMEVTRAGSEFNAFDAYVGYDPAALTPVPLSPISQQEGAYFVSACPNRYHRFRAGTDRDTITDVLLCAGVSVTGPGQIYRLRFQASTTPQVTTVRFLPGLQFYNAGLYVNPDSSSDATIGIGRDLGVGPEPHRAGTLRISVAPNPARGAVSFTIETGREGAQRLIITDIQGRVVRRLQDGHFTPGMRMVAWDGINDSGLVARPGKYVAMLRVQGRTVRTGFMLLE